MLYELGLQATFAVCLWILIDLLGARGARARRLPVMCLAASCALWVVGELLTSGAQSDAQVLFGRRLLYLGISGTLLSWLWTSAVFSRARWLATRPWLLAVAALPMFGLYSLLWWDPNGHFLHWTAVPPQRGWAFWPFAGIGWLLTLIGSAHFFVAAGRLRRWPLRMAGVLVGCLMPLVGSVLYLGFGVPSNVDPTPILIGASGVVLRLSILDSGLAVMLPMGRRSVFEQLDTGALLADLQGIVVDANPAARRLLHRQDLLGCSLDDLLEEARSDKARVIEVERVSLRGRLRDVGTAALIKDRSEAVRLERQVQEQQRLESLGLLASGAAHDFNNLLTAIAAHASLARDGLTDARTAKHHLDEVLASTRIAAGLTEQLLAYSGRGPHDARPLQLSQEVARLEGVFEGALREGVRLELDLDPELPAVEADPAEIGQLTMNLAWNGAQAIAAEGRVRLRTYRADLDPATLRRLVPGNDARPGPHAVLEVRDTGCGMEAAVKRRIFEPFFTTKDKGHGLGLAAILGIVHRCHGGVEVESSPGKGSTFRVFLPVCTEPVVADAPTPVESSAQGQLILCVDDDESILEVLSYLLERFGYRVLLADGGERALELVREHGPAIDLVILDLTLPGTSGDETLVALRALQPQIRVLISSGYAAGPTASRVDAMGATGFLRKPYDAEQLAAHVAAALESLPGTPAAQAVG